MSGDTGAPSPGLRVELPPKMSASEATAAVAKEDLSPSEALLTPSQAAPSKLASPAPLESSLTPPPSTQQPTVNRVSIARTPTPQASQLSSPPPTTKLAEPVGSGLEDQSAQLPSTEWVATASADELRERVAELAVALRQVRAEAASYKMQYSLLRMESGEQHQRMLVELDMVQREVEVLQMAEAKRQAEDGHKSHQHGATPDPNAVNANLLNEMSRHCATLQRENDEFQDANAQLHRALEYREDQVAQLTEDNDRLRTRIRRNREHTNSYLEYIQENTPQSLFSSPYQQTPRSRAPPTRPEPMLSAQSTGLASIDALLAAGQVLSQETTTAPSTPHRAHASSGNGGRRSFHQRAVHSLSSLPSTPQRSRAMTGQSMLQTPVQFAHLAPTAPSTEPPLRHHQHQSHQQGSSAPYTSSIRRNMRAGSSDSTITASSVEGGPHARADGDEDDDVPESQASQAATSMLRRTPVTKSLQSSQKSSFGDRGGSGRTGDGTPGLRQTKLFGQITKPGMGAHAEKRRLSDNAMGQPGMKRARIGEGVGLGIH